MVENAKPESLKKPEKTEFDEVMLAMDVVDTLRHEQLLVERELASDERDQALIEKVKRMYAAQGLEVSDEIIAAGVKALKENRFTYQPPPRGSAWLANLYVRRNRLAKWTAILAAALIGLFFFYRFAFVAPEIRQRQKEAKNFNSHSKPAAGSAQCFQTAAHKFEASFGSGGKISHRCRGCRQTTPGGGRAETQRS